MQMAKRVCAVCYEPQSYGYEFNEFVHWLALEKIEGKIIIFETVIPL